MIAHQNVLSLPGREEPGKIVGCTGRDHPWLTLITLVLDGTILGCSQVHFTFAHLMIRTAGGC